MTIYMNYNEWLEDYIKDLEQELKETKNKKKEVYKWVYSLEKENKALTEGKNIWIDSHRLVTQEIDKLKQELKEYRGF